MKKTGFYKLTKGFLFFSAIFFTSFLFANTSSDKSLRLGTYSLEGNNPNSNEINYRGTVEIQVSGSCYLLTWKIGQSQTQIGVGILQDRILSVAFYDCSGKSTGVVSYRLTNPDQLEGLWLDIYGDVVGKEHLTFKY